MRLEKQQLKASMALKLLEHSIWNQFRAIMHAGAGGVPFLGWDRGRQRRLYHHQQPNPGLLHWVTEALLFHCVAPTALLGPH